MRVCVTLYISVPLVMDYQAGYLVMVIEMVIVMVMIMRTSV